MSLLWKSDQEDGTYKNPILFADYSDPDVIRVGDTYYMTASSFNYVPGLPILTSKDLVNWELKNYAIEKIDEPGYDLPQHAKGVWAPAIRYHEGYFYIYYGMPDEGIYMVRTKDALGTWEKPVLVLAGKGLIDSCPFWDEDGKAYIIMVMRRAVLDLRAILAYSRCHGMEQRRRGRTISSTVDLRHSRRLRDQRYISETDIITFLLRQAV